MYKTLRMIPLQAVSEEWLATPLVVPLSWLLLSVMLSEHVHCTVIQRPCYLTETLLKGIVLCEPFLQLYCSLSPRREDWWERQHL